jgi:hypothetical protein
MTQNDINTKEQEACEIMNAMLSKVIDITLSDQHDPLKQELESLTYRGRRLVVKNTVLLVEYESWKIGRGADRDVIKMVEILMPIRCRTEHEEMIRLQREIHLHVPTFRFGIFAEQHTHTSFLKSLGIEHYDEP